MSHQLPQLQVPSNDPYSDAPTRFVEVTPPTPITDSLALPHGARPSLRHRLSSSILKGVDTISLGGRRRRSSSNSSRKSINDSEEAEKVLRSPPGPSPAPNSSSSSSPTLTTSSHPSNLTSLNSLIKSSKGVPLIVINQTGLPLQIATWPVQSANGEVCEIQASRGDGVVASSVGEPWRDLDGDVIEIGTLRWPDKSHLKHSHREGWIFFDLLVPPPLSPQSPTSTSSPHALPRPYRIHCQSYLRLTSRSHSSAKVGLGRFDLDSNSQNPMPSGSFGRVEVVFSGGEAESAIEAPPRPSFHGHRRGSSRSSSIEVVSDSGDESISALPPTHVKTSGTKFEGLGDIVEVRYFLTKDVKEVVNEVDDSTGGRRVLLPTKKIQVSSWCSHKEAVVSLVIHKEARYHESSHHHKHIHLPQHPFRRLFGSIKTSNHELEGFVSRGCWFFVNVGGEKVFDRLVRINPLDGKAIGPKLISTADSTAYFERTKHLTINYGFYDAGLSKDKQVYVYASRRNTTWLGRMVAKEPKFLEMPFEKLVLTGSHDAGMIGRISSELLDFINRGKVTSSSPQLGTALSLLRFALGTLRTFKVTANRVLENLAITQKDSIMTQLEMGVRFFDFRPGYTLPNIAEGVQGELRHMHSVVDGVSYLSFLTDILNFLGDHPSEIVFFEIKKDGFPFEKDVVDPATGHLIALGMIPSVEALSSELLAARTYAKSQAARDVKVGSPKDLKRSIGELLEENMRLIIADRVHEEGEWERGDSYTSQAYSTDDPTTIKAALEVTHQDASDRAVTESGPRSTIYQLQATPTAEYWADVGASLTYSDSSSLLVWAKCIMDRVTYPWIASKEFGEPGLVVFLNDFSDGALVELAVEKSWERGRKWLEGGREVSL